VLFVLAQGLGTAPRSSLTAQVRALGPEERRELFRLGVTLGRRVAFMPELLKPEVVRHRALLWSVYHAQPAVPLPADRPSLPYDERVPSAFYLACGYQPAGPRVVRVDCLHRFETALHRNARPDRLEVTPELLSLIGCRRGELPALLGALGYVEQAEGRFAAPAARPVRPKPRSARARSSS